jgi:tetratricopeptide (TPR) repeat protein
MDLVHVMPVPGEIALRGRFHFLSDDAVPGMSAALFGLERNEWTVQICLAAAGDRALIRNDHSLADAIFGELLASCRPDRHELPAVDALLGLGDAARQDDKIELAIAFYSDALERGRACHYRFGVVRALVSIGYLTLQTRTANEAHAVFDEAETISRQLDERLYVANALTGKGEALGRLGRAPEARAALREAIELFEFLRSDHGIVNASQHLGDVERRAKDWAAAAGAFGTALDAAGRVGLAIGLINALDGLAEVRLAQGSIGEAVELYERAYDLSERYLRGQAHALNGLGRCAAASKEWERAEDLHVAAAEGFAALDDMMSVTNALDGAATACAAQSRSADEIAHRIDAVRAIEAVRSAQDAHEHQQELRERFAAVYGAALRSAIRCENADAFVAVFEAVAGRRLAGLVGAVTSEAMSDTQLVSDLAVESLRRPFDGSDVRDEPSAHRRARLMGRLALHAGLPRAAGDALADVTAALAQPFDPDTAGTLLEDLARNVPVLLVTLEPDEPSHLSWLLATSDMTTLGSHELSPAVMTLVSDLREVGLQSDMRLADINTLNELLPPSIREGLALLDRLLVVPLGNLWGLPWPALSRVDGALWGETLALSVCPSLTLARHSDEHNDGSTHSVAIWRNPTVKHHEIVAFVDDDRVVPQMLADAAEAVEALRHREHDLLIVVGHGRPREGVGHAIELDEATTFTPAALLNATAPRSVALITCWGASTPKAPAGDPLTVATMALARGSAAVAATTAELADDPLASRFVNRFLYRVPDMPMADALVRATRDLLADPAVRDGPLARWAPMCVFGAGWR